MANSFEETYLDAAAEYFGHDTDERHYLFARDTWNAGRASVLGEGGELPPLDKASELLVYGDGKYTYASVQAFRDEAEHLLRAANAEIARLRALLEEMDALEARIAELESREPGEARWISVEERLPEKHNEVIIAFMNAGSGPHTSTAVLIEDGWVEVDDGSADLNHLRITHWQPLPSAPQTAALLEPKEANDVNRQDRRN